MPTSPDTAYPSAKTDRQAVCDEWTRLLGLPPDLAVIGLEQRGMTLKDARYTLLLRSGHRVKIGRLQDLETPWRVGVAIALVLYRVVPSIDKHAPRWHQALRDLLPLRTLV